MKKDGFVSMTLVYTFLILFLFLMLAVLNAYTQQNKYLEAIDSKIDLTINTPNFDNYCPYNIGQSFDYNFITEAQSFVAACDGTYLIELWGAQGTNFENNGGKGGYTSGNLKLSKDEKIYIYVGEMPKYESGNCVTTNQNQIFNGSVNGCNGGGGATDVRIIGGDWNNPTSLKSRIMVAAGGGGSQESSAGGLYGYPIDTNNSEGSGGRQISNSYGLGETGISNGAGGYYGGKSSSTSGGGGSSYISGHAGCIAGRSSQSYSPRNDSNDIRCSEGTNDAVCSYHYSNKLFTNTTMIDGKGFEWTNEIIGAKSMPSYIDDNPIVGNSGNGHARITYMSE